MLAPVRKKITEVFCFAPTRDPTPSILINPASYPVPPLDPELRPSKVMNQMRKWKCHFDGRDPWVFLERITRLKRQCEYPDHLMLMSLPELMRGNALAWYDNTCDDWKEWADFLSAFKTQFLPHEYREHLKEKTKFGTEYNAKESQTRHIPSH